MTEEDLLQIKKDALYRLHQAKKSVEAYRCRLKAFGEEFRGAGRALRVELRSRYPVDQMRLVTINDKTTVEAGRFRFEYPSIDQLVSIVESYKSALEERSQASNAAQNLGLNGF